MKNLKSEILCRIPLNIFILKFACKTAVRKWSDIYFVVFFVGNYMFYAVLWIRIGFNADPDPGINQ
jgi:hypothetical protein